MNRPRIVCVVQARMGSTRLPGKMMLPLAGRPLLYRLLERIKRSRRVDHLVLATTNLDRDEPLAELAAQAGVACVRGDESDVLSRFITAARETEADILVRLTGDNPLVCGALVDELVDFFLARDLDYASNIDNGGFPYGLYGEILSRAALERCGESENPADREHVTWFVRRNPEAFRIAVMPATATFAQSRVTVDTPEDYEAAKLLFESHFAADPNFSYRALMKAEPSAPM